MSFLERRCFFSPIIFVSLCAYILLCFFKLVFVCIMGAILLWCIDYECCHDASLVTAHVDHVIGFSIFTVFQVSSLALMVDHDHFCSGPFADVFSVDDSLTPFLVQQNSNSVFVDVFSCISNNIAAFCCLSHLIMIVFPLVVLT